MKASFKLNAETEVEIFTHDKSVTFQIVRGVWFDGEDNRTRELLWLTKSEARAVASAMMGCAAEV